MTDRLTELIQQAELQLLMRGTSTNRSGQLTYHAGRFYVGARPLILVEDKHLYFVDVLVLLGRTEGLRGLAEASLSVVVESVTAPHQRIAG